MGAEYGCDEEDPEEDFELAVELEPVPRSEFKIAWPWEAVLAIAVLLPDAFRAGDCFDVDDLLDWVCSWFCNRSNASRPTSVAWALELSMMMLVKAEL